MFEQLITGMEGHLIIREKDTRIVHVDKKNAIHFGNMSWAVSQALAGNDEGHITYMVFGNGGTSIDGSGNISYRAPNVSNIQDPNALPYGRTYFKEISLQVVPGTSNFSDLRVLTTLEFGEPSDQDPDDQQSPPNGDYIFDEIALFTETSVAPNAATDFPAGGRMVTHVIFHPVLKALNRELEIEYTIRVQMGP